MSMLGDVVFCVDCDRARLSHLQAVPAGTADPLPGPPRRMAIKQDANRDPLCASCLDLRQAKRRAEFMLHEARPTTPVSQPSPAAEVVAPRKRVEFVRIARVRTQEADVSPTPRKQSSGPKRAAPHRAPAPKMSTNRRLERQFLMLVLEIGFLRAQELLDELKRSARSGAAARRPALSASRPSRSR
jgi:hypothetical protein